MCRYITRPAIANERLKRNRAGDVVLQLKSPYQDGTTHIVLSPLEFMQHLAALVPRPRLNLIRFHGVLAPHAKLRPQIIPGRPASVPDDLGEASPHWTSARISWARLLKRVFDIDIQHCLHCGGTLKIIAAIEDPVVITKILAHLGLPTRAPPHHLRYAIPAALAVQPIPRSPDHDCAGRDRQLDDPGCSRDRRVSGRCIGFAHQQCGDHIPG